VHWIHACKEGTVEGVGAVKEVLQRIVAFFVSILSLSGKERGPRLEL